MRTDFDFISDVVLRKDHIIAYEVLTDVELDMMRYMCSITQQELTYMIESKKYSCEIQTLLNYSKIHEKNIDIVLNSMHDICWCGYSTWKANATKENIIATKPASPRTKYLIDALE